MVLSYSSNYIWNSKDMLGQGASGSVFKAIHSKTGESFAVKVFNRTNLRLPPNVRMRESEILRKLDHENVVRLLAIEEELHSTGTLVLVMELCTGGSLLDILIRPENACGLTESEYLLVQCHIAAGMKHLWEHGVVHRDIKPGNIMRYIEEDGRSVYKLGDFGAARELQQNQKFESIWGTPEYLYPGIFKAAIRQCSVASRNFDASVDLWSVGVTLYHVATGQLPFRPFGGRNNHLSQDTMIEITTKKASGIISGIQFEEGGKIEWSSELPEVCQLSKSLKELVTPLLAGLMESDDVKKWGFEKFFDSVSEISNKGLINLFNIKTCSHSRLFCDQNTSIADVRLEILKDMGTDRRSNTKNNIQLLFEGQMVQDSTPVGKLFTSSEMNPVFLFVGMHVIEPLNRDRGTISLLCEPTSDRLDADYGFAVGCTEILHYIRRLSAEIAMQAKLLRLGAKFFLQHLQQMALRFKDNCDKLMSLTKEANIRFEAYCDNYKIYRNLLSHLGTLLETYQKDIKNYVIDHDKFVLNKETVQQILNEVKCLGQKADLRCSKLNDDPIVQGFFEDYEDQSETDRSVKHMDTILRSAEETVARFKEDSDSCRSSKMLTKDRYLTHNFHRTKLAENCVKARDLLNEECIPRLTNMFESFQKWYSLIETIEGQLVPLSGDYSRLSDRRDSIVAALEKHRMKLQEDLDKLVNRLCAKHSPIIRPSGDNSSNGVLFTKFH